MTHLAAGPAPADVAPRLLRIQEVADETGLTPRAIRYYEEMGLLAPAARSEGAYRLYDAGDLERLRFIAGLRNDAGFSLAEIGQLLEDERARARDRARFRSGDPADQRAALGDALARIERQLATLEHKRDRLDAMLRDAAARRDHLMAHVADLDAGRPPDHAPHAGPPLHAAAHEAMHAADPAQPAEPASARGADDQANTSTPAPNPTPGAQEPPR